MTRLARWLRHDPVGNLYAILTLAAWATCAVVWAYGVHA